MAITCSRFPETQERRHFPAIGRNSILSLLRSHKIMGENLKLKGKMHNILCFVRKKATPGRTRQDERLAAEFSRCAERCRLKIGLRSSFLSRV